MCNTKSTFWQQAALWQGGLDLQYLQTRYEKGKTFCADYMAGNHVYAANETGGGLTDAHASLLEFMNKNGDGGDTSLVLH